MTRSANPVTGSSGDDTARMERVLDAAAELLVRWGYRRVTVEDVARHAGVGKGTVYLHVRTKDALFLTVLLRAQRRLFADLADRMVAEPATALPWRMTRLVFDRLQADDVARVLYLGDAEVLGQARARGRGHARRAGPAAQRRRPGALPAAARRAAGRRRPAARGADPHLGRGDVRLLPHRRRWPPTPIRSRRVDPARQGALLEHTLHAALAGPADPVAAAALAGRVADLYRPLVAHIDDEWTRRVR